MRTAPRNRRTLNRLRIRPGLARLEDRTVPTVLTFQQGIEGTTDGLPNGFVYAGTQDTELQSAKADQNLGNIVSISVDCQDGLGLRQGLLRFDDVFGPALSQVPFGSTINKATVTLRVQSSTDTNSELGLYRMRQPWSQNTATPNTFLPVPGVQTDGIEAESFRDWNLKDNQTGSNIFVDADVTASFRAWSTGTSNFGWLVDQTGVNGWDFSTGENTGTLSGSSNRPKLTIDFTAPSGNGSFQFAQSAYPLPEPDVGTAATTLLVTRSGGLAGVVSVDYTITPLTATAGVDYDNTVTTGTLTFGPNVTNQPLQIKLLGDTDVEGPETFKITLSNAKGGASVAAADTIITINDNDLLINEIVANHTSLADDGYEYIEITGAANATVPAGTYLAVFNSESGATGGVGQAQVVVNLSGQKLGSNGLLIVTPTKFNYTVPSATTRVIATQLDAVGGGISDDVISVVLVYSPDEAVVQGTDYDTSAAAYVDDATPFLNDGILDIAPFVPTGGKAPAIFLDSVGSVEGPNGQADRVVSLVRPGIRITIPDDLGVVTEVARFCTDGFTRVDGDRQANSTGAWYNGELNGATVIYATGLASSGRTPPGGQITPGDRNLPRGITFAVTAVTVNETAGTVTLLVNRSGDDSVATSIDFATADGTALAGVGKDYTANSGQLSFGIGINQQPIVIAINNDSNPEGFESFFVNLSNPGAPFALVTPQAKVTINDDDAAVATFQDGDLLGEYTGTRDVGLYGWLVNDKLGGDLTMSIDRNDDDPTLSNDLEKPNQGLIRFDDIFGSGPGQVPVGSTIFGGFITFNVTDGSSASARISLHRMLSSWNEFAASFAAPAPGITNGVTYDDVEARVTPDGLVPNPAQLGPVDVQLAVDTLQAWANGTAGNFGWTIQSDVGNGWDFDTSDQIGPNLRPKLTLIYSAPSGDGTVRFAEPTFAANEDAGTATLTVQRPGATTGTLTVDWKITGGTATAADYTGPTSGQLVFGPTDLSLPINIALVNDADLETNETVVVTLSGAGVTFTRDTATLTIRDNDLVASGASLLLNEFYINPSGNDNPYEYAELLGTPGAALGNLYIVGLRGDPDVFAGNADAVIDLSTFANGSNGFTIARGANGFPVPAGTTVVARAQFDTGDNFQNASNSFILVYSPRATIAEGYDFDWGNDGTLSLPDGAVVVDAVGFQVPGAGGKVYGGNELVQGYTPQGVSRKLGDTTPNTADWFRGTTSAPNDSLAYSAVNNTNLPVIGAGLTPGAANTSAAAPLTALTAVAIDVGVQRSMVRSVTLTFSNPVQFVSSPAIGLTDQLNNPVTGVSLNVAGVGSNTLTVTFTGSPVIGGSLPDGLYRLTVAGQFVSADGRTVDAKNDGTPGSTGTFDFHRLFGDSDGDRDVDAIDFGAFRGSFGGSNFIFDFDGDGDVDAVDFGQFRGNFGTSI